MLLFTALACLPLPVPDFRRPASFITFEGGVPAGITVRACTWSMWHTPDQGCDNLADGEPAVDGIGVPEWTDFPLVLGLEPPYWADAFVACEGARPRGMTLRLPDLQVKHDAEVAIVLDGPTTKWGASPARDIDDAAAASLAAGLCAGTVPLYQAK